MTKKSRTKSDGEALPIAKRSHVRHWPWQRISELSCLAVAVVALFWLAGDLLATRFTLNNTTISGRYSNAAIRTSLAHTTLPYQLAVRYPDGSTKTYGWQALGLQVDTQATVAVMRHTQHSWSHILHWWRPITVQLQLQTNQVTLQRFVAQHASIVTAPAQNPTLAIDNGEVKVHDGTPGKQYGLSNAAQVVTQAVKQLQTTPLTLTPVDLPPDQNEASLAEAKAQVTAILGQHLTIAIGTQTVVPTATDIANWLVITPTPTGAAISIDSTKVHDYLANVADAQSQPARSQIVLSSTGEVIQEGVKGIVASSPQSVVDSLVNVAMAGQGGRVALPIQYTAYQTVDAPTSGKWIEVNLSTKRMYAYSQGSLLRTFLISAGAPGTPTVTGSFAIYSKYASQDMYGQNLNGTRYYQPAVPWVNYFYRDYAIHGNYWRPSYYFGSVNSSHGCVGIPVSDGAWVYSWAPIGTPVIVHY